ADLSAATVTMGAGVTVRVGDVAEVLTVDGGAVVAEEARRRHETGDEGLDAWLDKVVSTLALRVAAESEESDEPAIG
ncbi:MAG: hypothetical protein M3326_08960, partial [Actinomycetota bacterium]|nr:hypothetical protein [Actinomycetota bacterium]